MEQRICKHCLLKELTDSDYFQSVYHYISQLPQEQKTEELEYHHRLQHCQECDELINGMCSACGCFVEVRAAKKNQHCPGKSGAW